MRKKPKSGAQPPLRKKPIDQRIGARIAQLRRRARLTQGEVARELKIGEQQVRNYERGRSRIVFEQLIRLTRIIGCSWEDLLPPALRHEIEANRRTMFLARSRHGAKESASSVR